MAEIPEGYSAKQRLQNAKKEVADTWDAVFSLQQQIRNLRLNHNVWKMAEKATIDRAGDRLFEACKDLAAVAEGLALSIESLTPAGK